LTASQQTLSTFDQPQTSRITNTYRKNSTDQYEVIKIESNKFTCTNAITRKPCEGHKRNGKCSHIAEFEIAQLKESLSNIMQSTKYFMERYEKQLSSKFKTFEAFYEWAWQGRGDPETVYLANLFIALLYCTKTNSGTTDLIHFAVNEKFTGSPRKIGPVIRRLTSAGFITKLTKTNGADIEVKSERQINHGSMKKIYKLTMKGRMIITEVT